MSVFDILWYFLPLFEVSASGPEGCQVSALPLAADVQYDRKRNFRKNSEVSYESLTP